MRTALLEETGRPPVGVDDIMARVRERRGGIAAQGIRAVLTAWPRWRSARPAAMMPAMDVRSGTAVQRAGLALLALLAGAPMAHAGITRIEIASREELAGGRSFGQAGAYVRIRGVAHGELDPADPRNAGIADLELATRNARGRIEYSVDLEVLQPKDPARASGTLLYDVTNRGSKVALGFMHRGVSIGDPRQASADELGDGFLLERGYTLVWSGWDPTVAPGLMAARLPVARRDGEPRVRRIRDEFVFGPGTDAPPTHAALSYAAADPDPAKARLTVRSAEGDARREIPADEWTYRDERHIALLPEGRRFERDAIYDFWYPARDPWVLGAGFAATRDLVEFLRSEPAPANPLARSQASAGVHSVLALGVSQSGRFLHHFLELGMNRGSQTARVFDGMLIYVAGAGKVFANHAFGQPWRTVSQHAAHAFPEVWFPFGYARQRDPHSGRTAALLRGDASDPRILEANTASEYLHKGASLLHTDPAGTRDAELPPDVRLYLIAGTEHGGHPGARALEGACVHASNPHDPSPALRALLVALDEWVNAGREPPPSRIPRIADGTLVPLAKLGFPTWAGVIGPPSLSQIRVLEDWIDPPREERRSYGALLPAVDADGNELAGIRLPGIAVPLATYTAWNRFAAAALAADLCGRLGSILPFARTRAERQASGDPRPSLEERYADRGDFASRVRAAAERLVAERLLLPQDARAYAAEAAGESPATLLSLTFP